MYGKAQNRWGEKTEAFSGGVGGGGGGGGGTQPISVGGKLSLLPPHKKTKNIRLIYFPLRKFSTALPTLSPEN